MKLRCRVGSAVRTATIVAAVVPGALALGGIASAAPPASAAPSAPPARAARSAPGFIKPPCATARTGQMRCFFLYRPQTAVNQALIAWPGDPAARPDSGRSPLGLQAAEPEHFESDRGGLDPAPHS